MPTMFRASLRPSLLVFPRLMRGALKSSHFVPQLGPRVFRIEFLQLLPQLARAYVMRGRGQQLDLHDLIAALAVVRRRRDAFFAQPQLLPALRARRNLELGAPVDGGHFN